VVNISDTALKWNFSVAEEDFTKIALTSQHDKKIWQPSETSIQQTLSEPAKARTVDVLSDTGWVVVWPWPAAKDHMAALSPLLPLGWGGEWEEKGKTCELGHRQFTRTSKEANSNNNHTDKNKGINGATLATGCPVPSQAMIHLPLSSSPTPHLA